MNEASRKDWQALAELLRVKSLELRLYAYSYRYLSVYLNELRGRLSNRPTLSDRLESLSATLMRCRESNFSDSKHMKWHGEGFEEEGGANRYSFQTVTPIAGCQDRARCESLTGSLGTGFIAGGSHEDCCRLPSLSDCPE